MDLESAVPSPNRAVRVRPYYRTIVAVDIEGSTDRADPVKAALRHALYRLLWRAFGRSGVEERHLDALTDRGDGALALVRPCDEVPKTLLLHPFVTVLGSLLAAYNADPANMLPLDRRFRLRVVVHAGETHRDRHGTYGEALDVACRLLDSPATKAALRHTDAPLVLVVSEDIYHSIVRHDYEGIRPESYAPLTRVRVAGRAHQGWGHVPPREPRPTDTLPPPADGVLAGSSSGARNPRPPLRPARLHPDLTPEDSRP